MDKLICGQWIDLERNVTEKGLMQNVCSSGISLIERSCDKSDDISSIQKINQPRPKGRGMTAECSGLFYRSKLRNPG